MRYIYRPDLVEQVILLVTRRDAERECQLHARIDHLYAISDRETREAAFREAYGELFREWEVGRETEDFLASLMTGPGINRCVLAPAAGRAQQRVDLLSKQDEEGPVRTLFIQIVSECLIDPTPLLGWLRREMLQVSDMLDPAFGYQADDLPMTVWERKLFQDRYMVLWKMYVECRLGRAGLGDEKETANLLAAFEKSFRFRGTAPLRSSFVQLLAQPSWSHAELRELALNPGRIDGRLSSTTGSVPGGLCPLCGFPTHDWFDWAEADPAWAESIRHAKPNWTSGQGACRQCAETYAARAGSLALAGTRGNHEREDCEFVAS